MSAQLVEKVQFNWAFSSFYGIIICPEYQVLNYSTTNRGGYREYKSDSKICESCPTKNLCTESKQNIKTVTRHVWSDYIEWTEDIRHTPKYQKLHKQRKETIERVFADAKEKHAMRYTPYRGLAQVENWVKLKFAAMNLKKYAIHIWKTTHPTILIRSIYHFLFLTNLKTLNLV